MTSVAPSPSSAPISHQPASRELPILTSASFSKTRVVTGGHRDVVNCVDWTHDGRKLASSASGGDKGIRIWDAQNLSVRGSFVLNTPHAAGAQISRVRWNPVHLSELVSAGGKGDPQICFWDVRASASTPLTTLKLASSPFEIAHHPEGGVLAVVDLKDDVTFYDRRMVTVEKPLASTPAAPAEAGATEKVEQAAWSASGSSIPNPNAGSKDIIFDISFTASGDHFCAAWNTGKVSVRSWASLAAGGASTSGMDVDGEKAAAEPDAPWLIDAQMGACNSLRFSRDGRLMATAGTDAIVNLWSTDEAVALKSFGDMSGESKHVAFNNSGELLAAGGDESAIYFFSTMDETFITKVPTIGPASSLAWSPKADILAYSTADRGSAGTFGIISTTAS